MLTYKSYGNLFSGDKITLEALANIYSDLPQIKSPLLIYDSAVDITPLIHIEFSGVAPVQCKKEPTYEYLEQVIKKIRFLNNKNNYDLIVGVGGGSALDITKAVSVLISDSRKRAISLRGFDNVKERDIPVVLIPTTFSGSEATNNASFVDTEIKKKMGINGRHMFCEYSILDSQWLPDKDSPVFVNSILDALTHAYESLVCRQRNILTEGWSKQAYSTIIKYLEGKDIQMSELQLCSYMAGRSLCNSGSGIAGAMSYVLGVHYGVPHGLAGAIFLPYVMDYNYKSSEYYQSEVLKAYMDKYKISRDLKDYGVGSVEEIFLLMENMQGAFDQNMRPFNIEVQGKELIEAHYNI